MSEVSQHPHWFYGKNPKIDLNITIFFEKCKSGAQFWFQFLNLGGNSGSKL
jgi:hypothetical protein